MWPGRRRSSGQWKQLIRDHNYKKRAGEHRKEYDLKTDKEVIARSLCQRVTRKWLLLLKKKINSPHCGLLILIDYLYRHLETRKLLNLGVEEQPETQEQLTQTLIHLMQLEISFGTIIIIIIKEDTIY